MKLSGEETPTITLGFMTIISHIFNSSLLFYWVPFCQMRGHRGALWYYFPLGANLRQLSLFIYFIFRLRFLEVKEKGKLLGCVPSAKLSLKWFHLGFSKEAYPCFFKNILRKKEMTYSKWSFSINISQSLNLSIQ